MDWKKLIGNSREILYALIVVFLIIIMIQQGQSLTLQYIEELRNICPSLSVSSYNPLTGLVLTQPGPIIGSSFNTSLNASNFTVS